MVKFILIAFCILTTLSIVKTDQCGSQTCKDEYCCYSLLKEEECCPFTSECDFHYGCLERGSTFHSRDKSKDCPPHYRKCSFSNHCCGFVEGECCSDTAHCCPHGYECDLDNQRCNQNKDARIVNEKDTPLKDELVKCGDKVWCPQTDECCMEKNGEHSCCRSFVQPSKIDENVTEIITPPPKVKECPPLWTRCVHTFWFDLCCPYIEAECCSDKAHCCPHGYECDLDHQRCNQKKDGRIVNETDIPLKDELTKCGDKVWCPRTDECCMDENGEHSCCRSFVQPLKIDKNVTEIITPQPKVKECPPLWTRCAHTFWFDLCCPYIEAECCSDKAHCCPHGYECDLDHQRCNQKKDGRIVNETDIPLKDELTKCGDKVWCPRTDECCMDENGEHSCCRSFVQPLKIDKNVTEIITPQPKVKECPPLWTRCAHTFWFDLCCPYIEAECCSDKAHCCPHGYECDLDHQRCNQKKDARIVNEKDTPLKDELMKCGDKVWCPRTDECCMDENGEHSCCRSFVQPLKIDKNVTEIITPQPKVKECPPLWTRCAHTFWFDLCCPYIEAECCSDKAHCCPHGYECDLDHQRCNQKKDARIVNEKDTPLKDELMKCGDKVWCPRKDECCMDENGEHSCCRSFVQTLKIDKNATEIITPQPKVKECPPLWTRCAHTFWFDLCCPYIEAECCSDKAHCCPHGYECDLDHQRCNQKKDARIVNEKDTPLKDELMKCGDKVWCPRTDECCMDENGEHSCCRSFVQPLKIYKNVTEIITPQPKVKECPPLWTRCAHTFWFDLCCPYIEAECCSDKAHCCPHGYECDLDHQRCNQKKDARIVNEKDTPLKDELMKCGDKVWCPRMDECCMDENGEHSCCRSFVQPLKIDKNVTEIITPQPKVKECPPLWTRCAHTFWFDLCCPYIEAECCSDKAYCCPHGYECDLDHQRCNQKKDARIVNEKDTPLKDELMKCGDKVWCPRTDECCMDENGEHSCCRSFVQPLKIDKIVTEIITPPPKVKECPPLWTRCAHTFWFDLCCPYIEAECCSDKAHCCPHGYECDLDNQRCNPKNSSSVVNENNIVSKDDHMQCSDNVWCPRTDKRCRDENGKLCCCGTSTEEIYETDNNI